MGDIRTVGPGKTRGHPYPVCKKSRVARDSLAVLHAPVSAISVFAPEVDNAADIMLHCILGWYLPIPHARTASRAPDYRKINLRRMTSEVMHLCTFDRNLFRTKIPHCLG